MKKNMNNKIRLVLTVSICILFIAAAFSSAGGSPQSNGKPEKKGVQGPYRQEKQRKERLTHIAQTMFAD